MDALFDSWDPDRVGAIEMEELCKRLRGADVHKGAESPLSLSGRACGKDTSDASPTASRRKSNASAASVQQQKNLERDRKVLFQRKMDAAARVTARREVDRQLLRDVTKLYAVYLQKCTYAAYTPPTNHVYSHHLTLITSPSHCCARPLHRWIYRNSPTNTGTFESVMRLSYPGMSQMRRTELMARAQACYAVRQQANDRAEVERCVRTSTPHTRTFVGSYPYQPRSAACAL